MKFILNRGIKILSGMGLILLLLIGCQSAPIEVEPEPTTEPTIPIPTQEPTATPEPTPDKATISTIDEMVGIWEGVLAGERGYIMYTADGQYHISLAKDNLVSSPRIIGEYWFEDGQIHMRDIENNDHYTPCEAEGVYEAVLLGDGKTQFEEVDDACKKEGLPGTISLRICSKLGSRSQWN